MDIDVWKFWIDIAQTLFTFGLGVWLYIDRRNDKTNTRIDRLQDDVDARLDNHTERLSHIEADLKHMPSHTEMGILHEKVNTVSNNSSRLVGEISQLRELVQSMHQFLLNNR